MAFCDKEGRNKGVENFSKGPASWVFSISSFFPPPGALKRHSHAPYLCLHDLHQFLANSDGVGGKLFFLVCNA